MMSELKKRELVCQKLQEATGLIWQPYLQTTDEGPEQDIMSYEAPLLSIGKYIQYDDVLDLVIQGNAETDDFIEKDIFNRGVEPFSMSGLGLGRTLREGHLAFCLFIRKIYAEDDNFLTVIRTSGVLQIAFKQLSNAPIYPQIIEAHRDLEARMPIQSVKEKIETAVERSKNGDPAP